VVRKREYHDIATEHSWRLSNNYLSVFHFGSGATAGTSDSGIAGYNLQGSANSGPGVIGGGAVFTGDSGPYLYYDSVSAYHLEIRLSHWRHGFRRREVIPREAQISSDTDRTPMMEPVLHLQEARPMFIWTSRTLGLPGCWHKMQLASHRWRLRRQSYRSIRRPAICGRYVNSDQRCYRNAIDFNRRMRIGGIPTVSGFAAFSGSKTRFECLPVSARLTGWQRNLITKVLRQLLLSWISERRTDRSAERNALQRADSAVRRHKCMQHKCDLVDA